jgi:hypothetical protein
MIYLDKNTMIAQIFERALDESTKDFEEVLDISEAENIDIMKTLLKKHYDVETIFNPTDPIRDTYLSRILAAMVISDVTSRNAYRKLGTFSKDKKEWAEKKLEELNKGIIFLDGLPSKPTEVTKPSGSLLFGNLSNSDFYI